MVRFLRSWALFSSSALLCRVVGTAIPHCRRSRALHALLSAQARLGAAIWRMCDWNISMRLLRPREWCCARQNSTWRSVLASEIRCSVETLQITAPGITCTQAMCAGVPKVIGDPLQLVWQRERRKSWLHSLLTAVHIGDCRVITLNPKSAMQSD